ncbi:MAG: hypothetical protein AAGJ35_09270, partial [Myxococcota bacterium]
MWCTVFFVSGQVLLWCNAFSLPITLFGWLFILVMSRLWSFSRHTEQQHLQQQLKALIQWVRQDRFSMYILGFSLGVFLLLLTRSLLLPPLSHDAMMYHGPRAAHFVQQGSFQMPWGPSGWGDFQYYPPAQEVLLAWFLLPTHSLMFFGVLDFFAGFFLFISILALWKHVQGTLTPLWTAFFAALFMAIPAFWKLLGAGYNDLLLSSMLLSSIVLLYEAWKTRQTHYVILCFMALGVAAGLKLPGLFFGGCLFLIAVGMWLSLFINTRNNAQKQHDKQSISEAHSIIVARNARALQWGKALWVGGACMFLMNVPWMMHNIQQTGLPLSPHPLSVAGIQLGRSPSGVLNFFIRRRIPSFISGYNKRIWKYERHSHLRLFFHRLQQGPVFGELGLLCFICLPLGLFLLWRIKPFLALLCTTLFGANLYGFYHPQFTFVRLFCATSNTRFLLQSACISCLSFALLWHTWIKTLPKTRTRIFFRSWSLICALVWGIHFFTFNGWIAQEIFPIAQLSLL